MKSITYFAGTPFLSAREWSAAEKIDRCGETGHLDGRSLARDIRFRGQVVDEGFDALH